MLQPRQAQRCAHTKGQDPNSGHRAQTGQDSTHVVGHRRRTPLFDWPAALADVAGKKAQRSEARVAWEGSVGEAKDMEQVLGEGGWLGAAMPTGVKVLRQQVDTGNARNAFQLLLDSRELKLPLSVE